MTMIFDAFDKPGFLPVRNRTVMSAMSRGFASEGHHPNNAMHDYYVRRAAAGVGLILTEGTIIDQSGDGWNSAPYIASDAHVKSWQPIVAAVQGEGALIACQLWHAGRISHEDYTIVQPVSSTNRAAEGINRQNDKPYGVPRALETDEIPLIYQLYVDAATRSLDAGFDAVELHLGHGYLADQFLDSRVNDRTDRYGGSIENRCRFTLELVEQVLSVVASDRLVARISPSRFMGTILDWPDLEEMIVYLIPALRELGLTALDVSCANSNYHETSGRVVRMVRPLWDGVIIAGASLSMADAERELSDGWIDLVTWGRAFIANPDLVAKMRTGDTWASFTPEMRDVLV